VRDNEHSVTIVRAADHGRAALVAWAPTVVVGIVAVAWPTDAVVAVLLVVGTASFMVSATAVGMSLVRRLRVFSDGVQEVRVSRDRIEVDLGTGESIVVRADDVESIIWWRSMKVSRQPMELGVRTRSGEILGMRTWHDGKFAGLWRVGWTGSEGLRLNRALRSHGYDVQNVFGTDLRP
jgi:hypothetical protein